MSSPEISSVPERLRVERREEFPLKKSALAEISGSLGQVEQENRKAKESIEKRFGPTANIGPWGIEGQKRMKAEAEAAMASQLQREKVLRAARDAASRGDTGAVRDHYDREVARGERILEERAGVLNQQMERLRSKRPEAITAYADIEAETARIEGLVRTVPADMRSGLELAARGMRQALEQSEVARLRRPVVDAQNELDGKIEFRKIANRQG